MMVFRHEVKQNYKTLFIWSLIVGGLIFLFMIMYSSLQGDIEKMADTYANMGSMTAAFGMDKITIATPMGFYGIEAGAMLSICGSMFGAMTGISVLSKEEHNHTAEFLLTHPIGRVRAASEKLLFVIVQVIVFNLICLGFAAVSFAAIGEDIAGKPFLLFHLAQFCMHLEIACICFAFSAFSRRQNTGTGLGFAAILYFLSLMYNITESAKYLKYVTPFVYSDAGSVMSEEAIDMKLLGIGIGVSVICIAVGLLKYQKKDIAA